MIKRLVNLFSSLRLTVVLLSLALVLVFIGTFAQVKLGLYVAQEEYFRSLFIFWQPKGASWKIPVFPGGWLLGSLLLINLLTAHIKRFQLTKKKAGIFLIHGGLILLLLGQFFTEIFQVESNIRFSEGETRNYSEDTRRIELAIIDVSHAGHDEVISIPETLLVKGEEIRHPKIPFSIRVKEYFQNSQASGPVSGGAEDKIKASEGNGTRLQFSEKPITADMNRRNIPATLMEFHSDKGSLGDWVASLWVDEPQTIEVGGRTYKLTLRPTRYYKPYSITLLDFRHDVYAGTSKPSNFSSKVHLHDPARGEEREVLIKMNSPLRHRGETFFQASFDELDDKVTILQVVKNPAAITPYLACVLVGLGLLVQFLMHLVSFGKKQRAKTPANAPRSSLSGKKVPATAATEGRSA